MITGADAWYGEMQLEQLDEVTALSRQAARYYVDLRNDGYDHETALRDARHSYG